MMKVTSTSILTHKKIGSVRVKPPQKPPFQLLVIDSSVKNSASLINALKPEIFVAFLNSNEDGVQQLTKSRKPRTWENLESRCHVGKIRSKFPFNRAKLAAYPGVLATYNVAAGDVTGVKKCDRLRQFYRRRQLHQTNIRNLPPHH